MDIVRRDSGIDVLAPAKVNLFFEILAKRSDGYHEIETLMVPIGLYDRLRVESDPSGAIELTARWAAPPSVAEDSGFEQLPPAEENLVTKAVKLLQVRAGVERGAKLWLTKRIPSAAGLGGGSSNAAAALAAVNALWQLGWTSQQLAELSAELGSDVPFFFARGAALCRGRGEIIEPIDRLPSLDLVVVRPPAGLSTAAVYKACRASSAPRSASDLIAALRRGDQRNLSTLIHNALQPAARELSDWIRRLEDEFTRLDCACAQMSGSGTAYFAICRHAAHARQVAGRLQHRGIGRIYVVRTM